MPAAAAPIKSPLLALTGITLTPRQASATTNTLHLTLGAETAPTTTVVRYVFGLLSSGCCQCDLSSFQPVLQYPLPRVSVSSLILCIPTICTPSLFFHFPLWPTNVRPYSLRSTHLFISFIFFFSVLLANCFKMR